MNYWRFTLHNGIVWHVKESDGHKVSQETQETALKVELISKKDYEYYLAYDLKC